MKNSIIEAVKNRRLTTFQELCFEVSGFRGDRIMFNPAYPAIAIWHAVSKEGITALGELIETKGVYMHLAPNPSYRVSDLPPFPICRSLEEGIEGTEIKWLPVVFTSEPQLTKG